MAVSDARFHAERIVRLAESPRMRELKADHQVIGASVTFLVCAEKDFAQLGQVLFVLFDDDELVRVRATIGPHGHRFAAVDQFRTALAEALPAAPHFIGCTTRGSSVPTFHRLNRPAIADAFAADADTANRLSER